MAKNGRTDGPTEGVRDWRKRRDALPPLLRSVLPRKKERKVSEVKSSAAAAASARSLVMQMAAKRRRRPSLSISPSPSSVAGSSTATASAALNLQRRRRRRRRQPEGHFEPLRRTKLTFDDDSDEEKKEEEVKTRSPFGPSRPLFTHTRGRQCKCN